MNISTNYYDYSSLTAQTSKRGQRPSLISLLDKDGDKSINADELAALSKDLSEKIGSTLNLSSLMSGYDADGNGSLDESEQESMNKEKAIEKMMMGSGIQFMRMRPEEHQSIASLIDKDSDNLWSTDELTQFAAMVEESIGNTLDIDSILSKYDADGDGSLNQEEQASMIKDMVPPPPPMFDDAFSFDSGSETTGISAVYGTDSQTDKDSQIREKMKEILEHMEEIMAKKAEEQKPTDNSSVNAESVMMAFLNNISRIMDTYEKSLWFENDSTIASEYKA